MTRFFRTEQVFTFKQVCKRKPVFLLTKLAFLVTTCFTGKITGLAHTHTHTVTFSLSFLFHHSTFTQSVCHTWDADNAGQNIYTYGFCAYRRTKGFIALGYSIPLIV